jgi:hypothetical protein
MEVGKLYPTDPIPYDCPAERQKVLLTCLWDLDTEQGAEGLLGPYCSKVICSHAGICKSLAKGKCPLTIGYGSVMKRLSVRVMHNLPTYSLTSVKGQIVVEGEPCPEGQAITFGRITVLAQGNDTTA